MGLLLILLDIAIIIWPLLVVVHLIKKLLYGKKDEFGLGEIIEFLLAFGLMITGSLRLLFENSINIELQLMFMVLWFGVVLLQCGIDLDRHYLRNVLKIKYIPKPVRIILGIFLLIVGLIYLMKSIFV